MKTQWMIFFCVAFLVGVLGFAFGCGPRDSQKRDDAIESVVAVVVDRGTATSEGNAQRVLLGSDGKAVSGWSRNPGSMRRLERLTEAQKTNVLRAAASAMAGARPGEYAFGSKEGDWIRVVIVTNKRRLVFDEAATGGEAPTAELRTILDAMLSRPER